MALSCKLRSKDLAKTDKQQDNETADRPGRDSAGSSDFSEALTVNPLLRHPAAAMAAATAIGFSFANQMASAFFGAMQGALEASNQAGNRPAEKSATEPVAETPVADVAATPVKAPAKPKRRPKAVTAKAPAGDEEKQPTKAAVKAPAKRTAKSKTKPKSSAGLAIEDDLKRISGIGPKLEAVLKSKGVTTLAEIAGWTDKDIARLNDELGLEGRIARDDWVGQAKALSK